jgi:hypothetical protein
MDLERLIAFYNSFTPDSVARFPEFYSADAYFKDPFNEVRGMPAIQRIFSHMFEQVGEPRFVVVDQVADAGGAMLVWEFYFRVRLWGKGEAQVMRGVSHLRFDAEGKVCYHRDYWDTGEELYMKLPGLGTSCAACAACWRLDPGQRLMPELLSGPGSASGKFSRTGDSGRSAWRRNRSCRPPGSAAGLRRKRWRSGR